MPPANLATLYRQILRAHKSKLPPPMKQFGDDYAREEFKRHLKAKTNDAQWQEFMKQWRSYVDMLNGQADVKDTSGHLAEDMIRSMTPDQRSKLEQLKHETSKLGNTE